jgi:hypothetical protein
MRKAGVLGCVALSGALLAAGCDSFSQAMTAHTDVVARAGSHELKVEQVAGWMAENPRLPAEPEVIEAVANLWVDYILLATEAARDSTLAMVDLDVLIRPQVDQEVVWKLRDKVIQVDTILSDDELRAVYDREQHAGGRGFRCAGDGVQPGHGHGTERRGPRLFRAWPDGAAVRGSGVCVGRG